MSVSVLPYQSVGPEAWDRFCAESSGAWFWHGSRWMEYQEARGEGNLSFGVSDDGGLVAICPLVLEHGAGGASFSMEGHPGPWPAFRDWMPKALLEEAREAVANGVEAAAKEVSVQEARFRSCPLASGCPAIPGFSNGQGWASRVADLTRPESELHARLRRSYRSLVNGGLRRMAFSWAPEDVEACRKLHFRASGRETRPRRTWELMRAWAADGHGVPVLASLAGRPVAFAYFVTDKLAAYYASGASLEPDLQHAVLWKAILLLKKVGYRTLELGWQGQAADAKGRGVERFKAGFPGEDVPVAVAERRFG